MRQQLSWGGAGSTLGCGNSTSTHGLGAEDRSSEGSRRLSHLLPPRTPSPAPWVPCPFRQKGTRPTLTGRGAKR